MRITMRWTRSSSAARTRLYRRGMEEGGHHAAERTTTLLWELSGSERIHETMSSEWFPSCRSCPNIPVWQLHWQYFSYLMLELSEQDYLRQTYIPLLLSGIYLGNWSAKYSVLYFAELLFELADRSFDLLYSVVSCNGNTAVIDCASTFISVEHRWLVRERCQGWREDERAQKAACFVADVAQFSISFSFITATAVPTTSLLATIDMACKCFLFVLFCGVFCPF